MTMTLDGTAGMTAPQGAVYNGLQMATAQASTSGTSVDFTGIPVWAKRVTVMFNGVSSTGSASVGFLVQLGSGTFTTSGYSSYAGYFTGPNLVQSGSSTSGMLIHSVGASGTIFGPMVFNNITGNTWVSSHTVGNVGGSAIHGGGGSIALSGVLDRVRITTTTGTDTFDAGSINIMYE